MTNAAYSFPLADGSRDQAPISVLHWRIESIEMISFEYVSATSFP
jgi:hypothetical protein